MSTIKLGDILSGPTFSVSDDMYYTSMHDDNTVTITTTTDSTYTDYLSDIDTSTWDVLSFDTETKSIKVGSTTLTEQKLEDLLTLLDIIENMPDTSGVKKLFNAQKAIRKIGGNSDQTESN